VERKQAHRVSVQSGSVNWCLAEGGGKETEISATVWALWLGKNFSFYLQNHLARDVPGSAVYSPNALRPPNDFSYTLKTKLYPFLGEIVSSAQAISPIATHFPVAWSVVLVYRLSHSCTVLKPLDGFTRHFAGTLVGPSDTLC